MSKPTVILSQRFSTDSQAVWKAAVSQGWDIHRAIRFSVPDPLPVERCVYGELPTCDIVAQRARLGLLDPADRWLAYLPEQFLKREVWCAQAWQIHEDRFNRRLFFKPANDKVFEKGVFERGADVPLHYVSNDCPLLISEVVAFDREVRLWCLDGKVVARDFYRIIGEHDPDDVNRDAAEFGQRVLDAHHHNLPSAVVVDVGYVEGRGWAVVEANQAYASGIYGDTDMDGVLQCILRSAGARESVRSRDERFVRC